VVKAGECDVAKVGILVATVSVDAQLAWDGAGE